MGGRKSDLDVVLKETYDAPIHKSSRHSNHARTR